MPGCGSGGGSASYHRPYELRLRRAGAGQAAHLGYRPRRLHHRAGADLRRRRRRGRPRPVHAGVHRSLPARDMQHQRRGDGGEHGAAGRGRGRGARHGDHRGGLDPARQGVAVRGRHPGAVRVGMRAGPAGLRGRGGRVTTHSTVTDLAKLRGLSTSVPFANAT